MFAPEYCSPWYEGDVQPKKTRRNNGSSSILRAADTRKHLLTRSDHQNLCRVSMPFFLQQARGIANPSEPLSLVGRTNRCWQSVSLLTCPLDLHSQTILEAQWDGLGRFTGGWLSSLPPDSHQDWNRGQLIPVRGVQGRKSPWVPNAAPSLSLFAAHSN